MARFLLAAVLIIGCSANSDHDYHCDGTNGDSTGFPREVCYIQKCTNAIKHHIKYEFEAAFLYMYMGATFAQDSVARPGMAKFMLESASEERGHAILMLDYLNKRGVNISNDLHFEFQKSNIGEELSKEPLEMLPALQMALTMEMSVTKQIHHIVKECENDYHGADVFTNPILDEQHEGIRKLQGAIQEYTNLRHGHDITKIEIKEMVDFIFDQKVLKGSL